MLIQACIAVLRDEANGNFVAVDEVVPSIAYAVIIPYNGNRCRMSLSQATYEDVRAVWKTKCRPTPGTFCLAGRVFNIKC
jgi:hypothetical protein